MAHMHYKGTGNIHSFRGQLANGKQDKIRIQGSVGSIAWRINKFDIMIEDPMGATSEAMVKIYREKQSSVTNIVNFTDDELMAVAFTEENSATSYSGVTHIIFDNMLFSRNIHVTAGVGAGNVSYYIELEQVKLSAAGMAQLAVAAVRRTKNY
jgi:hypothetical protein